MVKIQKTTPVFEAGSKDPSFRWSRIPVIGSLMVSLVICFHFFELQTPTSADLNSILSSKAKPTNDCDWRPEPLQGICDVTKSTEESKPYTNAVDCEDACCRSKECVTFQFRNKEGCLFGKDTRLGAEKDEVSAWCEPRPPAQWKGQRIKKEETKVEGACDDQAWQPDELSGQCFGLGVKRTTENNSPEACRDACCKDEECGIWQWRLDAGCFYSKRGHNCQEANPLDFEKFIGKRKVQPGRTYKPYAYSEDFADMAGIEKATQG